VCSLHIGDSGYIILRNTSGTLQNIEQSKDMLHGFNFPYQVGSNGDDPYKAKVKSVDIKQADIIVLATDGLWDNLFPKDIISIIEQNYSDLKEAAEQIARRAQEVALRENIETPFERKANKRWRGGKLDDITVIIAKVTKDASHETNAVDLIRAESSLIFWLVLILTGLLILYLYISAQIPPNMTFRGWVTRPISRYVGKLAGITIPCCLRPTSYALFCKLYNVNTEEIKMPMNSFCSIKDFFTREFKENARVVAEPYNNSLLCSPADSTVLAFGEVKDNKISCVKGHTYSLGEMIYGKEYANESPANLFSSLSKDENMSLYYTVLYLSPADYHRYHSPTALLLKKRCHVIGYLNPVKPEFLLRSKVGLKENERVSMIGQWEKGEMVMTFVGALNIGSMHFHFDKEVRSNFPDPHKSDYSLKKEYQNKLQPNPIITQLESQWSKTHGDTKEHKGIFIEKGKEMGVFNFGSTIVLIFTAPKGLNFMFKEKEHVLVGQAIFNAP
jgi:phosphatidylserine decarboxylase